MLLVGRGMDGEMGRAQNGTKSVPKMGQSVPKMASKVLTKRDRVFPKWP